MRYERDGYSVESAILKDRVLPEWYLDAPGEVDNQVYYMQFFWDLSSTRYYTGGPIPHNLIVQYLRDFGLDDGFMPYMVKLIQQMDMAYLKWYKDETDKKTG